MSLLALLTERVDRVFRALDIDSASMVQPAGRPEFGDYQINGVMAAAKARRMNPRELAQQLLERLDLSDIASKLEIAGPGFINIHLAPEFLAQRLDLARQDARLAVPIQTAQTVVVDYSGPNLAKEMHVGHLRSTIIGDALARVLEFLGHRVLRQNHVGDWGTQFGMLIAYLLEAQTDQPDALVLSDLEAFYRAAKLRFDQDAAFADRAREFVVRLQAGDAEVRQWWQKFIDLSLQHCEEVYQRLGVSLTREHVRGESSYNDALPQVVASLNAQGLLTESEGAQCVFLPEFVGGKDKEPLPCIVQKSDGGYLYATSDLAAVRYRVSQLQADRILYFVDARQALHLQQVFAISHQAGFAPADCQLEHMAFGTMMGEDGKPFKTRTGGTVKLIELLDEAEQRAFDLVSAKNPELDPARCRQIARDVGIGAVKYADLSKNRNSDYIFNWSTMLAFEGNTAPYLQYAYARVQSIFRKLDGQQPGAIQLLEPAERSLALHLAQFAEQLNAVARDGLPNLLCQYLYQLAGHFMRFYESCPILKAEPSVLQSRLALAELCAQTLKCGMGLLGLAVLDSM